MALLGLLVMLALAGLGMTAGLWLAQRPIRAWLSSMPVMRDEAALGLLAIVGASIYFTLIYLLLGRSWLAGFVRTATPAGEADASV